MNTETREKTARSLCHVQCIGSPGHHEQCYFPKAYVVGSSHTFFRHIAEANCAERGLPDTAIEEMTIQEAWVIYRHEGMPTVEQNKINHGIETQHVDTNISDKMFEQWAQEREERRNVKLNIQTEEEEESC